MASADQPVADLQGDFGQNGPRMGHGQVAVGIIRVEGPKISYLFPVSVDDSDALAIAD